MSMTDFGDPVPVKELPPPTARGGRESNVPALNAWLTKVAAAAPGTYELKSSEKDGAHPVSRGTQLRGIVNPVDENKQPLPSPYPGVVIETRAVVTGKRYKIYATKSATDGKAGARK